MLQRFRVLKPIILFPSIERVERLFLILIPAIFLSPGQVTSSNMHCLFDRKSNTMFRFLKGTQMSRKKDDNWVALSLNS